MAAVAPLLALVADAKPKTPAADDLESDSAVPLPPLQYQILAIVRRHSGDVPAHRNVIAYLGPPRHPIADLIEAAMALCAAGLLLAFDGEAWAITPAALPYLGAACGCETPYAKCCGRSWDHSQGRCGACGHSVACHNQGKGSEDDAR